MQPMPSVAERTASAKPRKIYNRFQARENVHPVPGAGKLIPVPSVGKLLVNNRCKTRESSEMHGAKLRENTGSLSLTEPAV